MKYILSAGVQHDGTLRLWDLQKKCLCASSRLSSRVHSVAFNESGSFVTCGRRHVKFWWLGRDVGRPGSTTLEGSSAILRSERESTFVAVARRAAKSPQSKNPATPL